MVSKNKYNLIAIFVAFLTYLFFIALLVGYIKKNQNNIKDYGYDVNEAIVVELDTKPNQNPTPEKKVTPTPVVPKIVEQKVIEPIVKESNPTPPIKEVLEEDKKNTKEVTADEIKNRDQEARDIVKKSAKDLFSTIRSKDYNKVLDERKKEDAARASRLAKQKAAKRRKEQERKKRAKAVAEAKALLKNLNSSSSSHKKRGQKDDFWSPITNRIMSKWNQTISTQDGLRAFVKIRIDNQGILSYKIKRLSNNSLFDTKLKVFLENLEYMKFPRYKDGSYVEATFEFKDQEK